VPFERQIYHDTKASEHSEAFCFAHATDAPFYQLSLWPYRSLPRRGFVWFIGLTAALISVPLLALLGSKYLWFMLPFLAAAVAMIWYFIERSYKDGTILETLTIWTDHMELTRQNPRAAPQHWQANPYWVDVKMHPKSGPVENYITLRGNNREVEIGAFLSAGERKILLTELQGVLARLPK
jgi:uncharacterized membrane protein